MSIIGNLASSVGAARALAEVPGISAAQAAELVDRGQRLCPIAEDQFALLHESVAVTMRTVAPESVHQVIVATETMTSTGSRAHHEQLRGRLQSILVEFGLGHATLTAMTFGGCAAVMGALEYAGLLVDGGRAETVLVIAVGVLREGDSRVLAPAVSAIGDGVATCTVSASGSGWEISWMRRRAFLQVADFDADVDFGPTLIALGRALRSLRPDPDATDTPELLIANNYGMPTLTLFASMLAAGTVFTENVSRLSHLGTPDILINLAQVPADVPAVLALATGPADCVLAKVERA